MHHGKNIFLYIIAIISIYGCMKIKAEEYEPGLSLKLTHNDNELILELKNISDSPINISKPIIEKQLGFGGIDFEIKDGKGDAQKMCALIDPPLGLQQKTTVLQPHNVISEKFDLMLISKMHCLNRGDYEIKAKFYNEIKGNSLTLPVLSNAVAISMR